MTVSIIFKNAGDWGSGGGTGLAGRLTSLQADTNNWAIKQAIETLQAATGKTISSAAATGNQLTITYTDATTDVITLPTAIWTMRGAWAASTSYAINDVISYAGSLYVVTYAHVADLTFDLGKQVSGNSCYSLLLTIQAAPSVNRSGATFTPGLADAGSYNRCSVGCTVTVPADDSVDFPLNTELHFRQGSTDPVIFEAESTDVDVDPGDDFNLWTASKGSVATLKKVGANQWDLFGRLSLVTV